MVDPGIVTSVSKGAMLASAVGDALGWPQENRSGRVGMRARIEPKFRFSDWQRRGGGRWANHQESIRAGEYSDDTQLVLAVARCLLMDEGWWQRWTQVELPFWLLYERGGGGAIKAAARDWSRRTAPWLGEDPGRYFAAGGNGVAMRVLPHCLRAAAHTDFAPLANDILADGLATHGHPRALVGALAYGFALWRALRREEPLSYGELVEETIRGVDDWAAFPSSHQDLPEWRGAAEVPFHVGYQHIWDETVVEMLELLGLCEAAMSQAALSIDSETLSNLGCLDPKINGAGTVTAAGAVFLASRYAFRPAQGLLSAAYLKGADTDTLAAMTGALLGAVNGTEWLGPLLPELQDHHYIGELTELLMGDRTTSGPSIGGRQSLAAFWRDLAEVGVGTHLELPDGRAAAVRGIVNHATRVNYSVRTWVVETSDGQTLFLKKTTKTKLQEQAKTSPETLMPYPERRRSRLGVVVEASNLERSIRFYNDALGLEVRSRTPDQVNFGTLTIVSAERRADASMAANQLRLPENPLARNPRIVVVIARDEFELVRGKVAALGVLVSFVEQRSGRRYFLCLDPDGVSVECREANDAVNSGQPGSGPVSA